MRVLFSFTRVCRQQCAEQCRRAVENYYIAAFFLRMFEKATQNYT